MKRIAIAAAGVPLRTITPAQFRAIKRQGLMEQSKTGSHESARRARQIAAGRLTPQNGVLA